MNRLGKLMIAVVGSVSLSGCWATAMGTGALNAYERDRDDSGSRAFVHNQKLCSEMVGLPSDTTLGDVYTGKISNPYQAENFARCLNFMAAEDERSEQKAEIDRLRKQADQASRDARRAQVQAEDARREAEAARRKAQSGPL